MYYCLCVLIYLLSVLYVYPRYEFSYVAMCHIFRICLLLLMLFTYVKLRVIKNLELRVYKFIKNWAKINFIFSFSPVYSDSTVIFFRYGWKDTDN